MNPFIEVIDSLNKPGIRYVIVGGFAVVMHGSNRFTPDLNLVVDYDRDRTEAVINSLLSIGLEAYPGIDPMEFLDEKKRENWLQGDDKRFLSLVNPEYPGFGVYLFAHPPLSFQDLYKCSEVLSTGEREMRICSLAHLIEMKNEAGRPQDVLDLLNLEMLRKMEGRLDEEGLLEECIKNLPEGMEEAQVENLIIFARLPAAEKLTWLGAMLTEIGLFGLFR